MIVECSTSVESGLARAVLQTAAYADIFDFPLTAGEIHRYLTGFRAPSEEVKMFLQESRLLRQVGGCYTLPGRDVLVKKRRQREAYAGRLWPKALRYGRLIARLPYVRMVAITGALAVNNVEPGADIDYLLVTEPGRVWSTRALVLVLGRLAALEGANLCPNYLVSLNALEFPDQTLYVAREIAQMVPLAGIEIYQRIRELNNWVLRFLPNAAGPPEPPSLPPGPIPTHLSTPGWEALLNTRYYDCFEQWEMKRKIARLRREQSASSESHFSKDYCKGHVHRHQARTQMALYDRLEQLQKELLL